jgi:hypothetical protein
MATKTKLYTNSAQTIPTNVWTQLRYDEVLADDRGWYAGSLDVSDPDSALIVPDRDFWGIWSRQVRFEPIVIPEGDTRPRQFLVRFVRDPYTNPDNTGEHDHGDTIGQDILLGTWQFKGRQNQPVAVEVRHNHHLPVKVVHSQFVVTTWDF